MAGSSWVVWELILKKVWQVVVIEIVGGNSFERKGSWSQGEDRSMDDEQMNQCKLS